MHIFQMSDDISINEENNGVIGCLPSVVDPLHVEEIEKIVENLEEICGNENLMEISFLKYSRLLHLYQEQPNLLDGLIPKIIDKLFSYIVLVDNKKNEEISIITREALNYISVLCVVRGKKTIVRLLPHQVNLLEPLLTTLEFYSKSKLSDHSQRNVLLLWLWIVVRNPFDLKRFDPSGDPNTVVTRILNIATDYMKWDWNSSQYSASLVIAQCLSRADGLPRVPKYLSTLLDDIQAHKSDKKLLLADLLLLLAVLKHVDRAVLLNQIVEIHEKIEFLYPINRKYGSLICKCLVKVIQRIGLLALKPRTCSWRYRLGKRLLDDVLNEIDSKDEQMETDENIDQWSEDAEMNHPEIVEWTIMHILEALSHSDTSVRWSAAKGIGRITTRLPSAEFATEIVNSITNSHFGETGEYSSSHRHGACLALAELARRGVLLPDLLDSLIPLIERSLMFEDMMGIHQSANQVRDAACYVVWAFARTYEPAVMNKYLRKLANGLMCCAIFDREVNLRRAASAAFQEMVGRQKNVPHGISLLTIVDYFAVTNRKKCYETICVKVAEFPEYSMTILKHLLDRKISHWDEKIREEAACSLENISSTNIDISDQFYLDVVSNMVDGCCAVTTSPILRHGYLLSLGHLIKGLSSRNVHIDEKILEKICDIPQHLKTHCDRLSQIGSMLRKATCRFMELVAESKNEKLLKKEGVKRQWIERIVVFVKDNKEEIRNLAQNAGRVFFANHLVDEKEEIQKLQDSCLKVLSNATDENERIGMCMLCEILPIQHSDDVFETLRMTILKPKPVDQKWAIARHHAIIALNQLVLKYDNQQFDKIADKYFFILYAAMDDYTTSAKGDIGRFVRESSMKAMAEILTSSTISKEIVEQQVIKCVKCMIQQTAERISGTRKFASECLLQILHHQQIAEYIAFHDILLETYNDPSCFISDKVVYRLEKLFETGDVYYDSLIMGIIISAGGLAEGTQKSSKSVLLKHQRECNGEKNKIENFLETCATLLKRSMKSARICNSFMQVMPQIFGNLGVLEETPDESDGLKVLIEVMKVIGINSTLMTRRRLSIDALAELLNTVGSSQIYGMARNMMLTNLSSEQPVLRKAAAERLYEHFCCSEMADEQVLDLLSTTNWQEECDIDSLAQNIEIISAALC